MAVIQVPTTFVINTRAKSAEVNANFSALVTALSGDHHNPAVYSNAQPVTVSGIAPNAQIKDTQLAPFTRTALIAVPGVITAAAIAGLVLTKFGGSGTDGALSISSGTTTLDIATAKVFIKNYTSISITGSALLNFINPNTGGSLILLKATGAVTLSSSQTPMIDVRNCGGPGGAATTSTVTGTNQEWGGADGTAVANPFISITAGARGQDTTANMQPGKPSIAISFAIAALSQVIQKYPFLNVGSGAGSGQGYSNGGTTTGTTGFGGAGAGALVIECGGTLNFTTVGGLSTNGQNGGNGVQTSTTSSNVGIGGGGGGGGGSTFVFYNFAGTITGTITMGASTGGTGAGTGVGTSSASGNGGGSSQNNGVAGAQGGQPTGGTGAISTVGGVILNTEYT